MPRCTMSMKLHASSLGIRAWLCAVVALVGVWGSARAENSGPAVAGRDLAAAICASCHGLDGNAPSAQFPKLAGQVAGFTALQLRNYRSGERPNPIMAGIAKSLSDAQIDAVSTYYASLKPMKPEARADSALALRGEQIYQSGKSGAPACKYCHG